MEPVQQVVEAGAAASSAAGSVFKAKLLALLAPAAFKAFMGMLGVALLYLVAPPGRPNDVKTTRRELAIEVFIRLGVAGIFSNVFGDWAVDVINNIVPILVAPKHPAPFYLAAGAPGWWISRWIALQLYAWRDKTAGEVIDNVRDIRNGGRGDK